MFNVDYFELDRMFVSPLPAVLCSALTKGVCGVAVDAADPSDEAAALEVAINTIDYSLAAVSGLATVASQPSETDRTLLGGCSTFEIIQGRWRSLNSV